jgi:hypothetical protein
MTVAVMSTCIGDAMFPDVVRATVRLLRRLGVSVDVPEAQTCCGQPMVNTGYLDEAVPLVRNFVAAFEGYDHVVVPSGSCAGSVRHQHSLVAAARAFMPRSMLKPRPLKRYPGRAWNPRSLSRIRRVAAPMGEHGAHRS